MKGIRGSYTCKVHCVKKNKNKKIKNKERERDLKQFSPPLIHAGEIFEKYIIEVSKAYLDTTVIIN